jgi:hypothetical protein
MSSTGAASDKVAALERAGAIVTDSPAKIGAEMLKVCFHSYHSHAHLLTSSFLQAMKAAGLV